MKHDCFADLSSDVSEIIFAEMNIRSVEIDDVETVVIGMGVDNSMNDSTVLFGDQENAKNVLVSNPALMDCLIKLMI